jgi:hypothetical protein
MKKQPPEEIETHLDRVIHSISARPGRKHAMREEMLGHLLESYRAELTSRVNDEAARQTAINRLGSTGELRRELQSCVPFLEQILFWHLDRKELLMSRLLQSRSARRLIAYSIIA